MSTAEDFARAAARHRDAIEEAARAVESVDSAAWSQPTRPGKWSPAEIAHHLILSYDPLLSELAGGPGFALRLPWWKRRLARLRFLDPLVERGIFPAGVPAPREIRPTGEAPGQVEAAVRLRQAARRFERRLIEAYAAGGGRLTHAYFGKLSATQVLKLLSVHARHHGRQLHPRVGGNGAP